MLYRRFTIFADRLRCFDNPDESASSLVGERILAPGELDGLIVEVERRYRASSALETQVALGRKLYDWLDGATERWLSEVTSGSLAVHIDASDKFRHLPWELLHDGTQFLCAKQTPAFTPIRRVGKATKVVTAQNRPLRVLFMASSPIDVRPVLSFETEEATLLKATMRQPIELVVEETGSLPGLEERFVTVADEDLFDVVHLTGHAGQIDNTPCFHLEDEKGMCYDATASEIAKAFGERRPRLLFLSGCWTGASPEAGAFPSLCEALVRAGFPAVLGWALPVGDYDATVAAAILYEQLAAGVALDEAVAQARQKLWEAKLEDWHLLRLFTDATMPSALVTRRNTPKRRPVRTRNTKKAFLDAKAKTEVCAREDFIGRRRELQRCLAVLRSYANEDVYHEGVLLQGMGGLGKSSLALRLCERLESHQRIVQVGALDEVGFLASVTNQLKSAEVIAALNAPGLTLAQRVGNLLEGPLATNPVLFVFDDFEQNLELDASGGYRGTREALMVLSAVVSAIHQTESQSRVIVTSRYDFALPEPGKLYREGLTSLRDADLKKKLVQLPEFQKANADHAARALALAGGNPRLLHWLAKILKDTTLDHDTILAQLEETAEKFRVDVAIETLLAAQSPDLVRLLARLAVCTLPVDTATVEAIAAPDDPTQHLARAVAVSLCERGIDPATQKPLYYVSPVVRPLVVGKIREAERKATASAAAKHLYEHGWKTEGPNDAVYGLEIIRLALLSGEINIAHDVGSIIARYWINSSRYLEAKDLCDQLLANSDNYLIRFQLARAQAILGNIIEARKNYETALVTSPTDDKFTKSGILFNLSRLLQQQGEVDHATELLTESNKLISDDDKHSQATNLFVHGQLLSEQGKLSEALSLLRQVKGLYEEIKDIQGISETLHEIARVLSLQGKSIEAMDLYEEALYLKKKINDYHGEASTLNNMANLVFENGNAEKARELILEAVQATLSAQAYMDLHTTILNLGYIHSDKNYVYFAQSFWICIFIQIPPDKIIITGLNFIESINIDHPVVLLVLAATLWLVNQRGATHSDFDELHEKAMYPINLYAQVYKVAPEQFAQWYQAEGLSDPNVFLPKLLWLLRELVGDSWVFDPAGLPDTEPWSHLARE